ncbi:DUF4041 domain-containing protein, partial [Streptococcus danieliae]|nr:DUF4041 domain-containing protein [Streptococcus danieliae]
MGLFGLGKPKDEVLENKIEKLNQQIKDKKSQLQNLELSISTAKAIISLDQLIEERRLTLEDLNNEIEEANDQLNIQEYGLFERRYKFSDSTKYKAKLDSLRSKQKDFIRTDRAIEIIRPIEYDGSLKKGKAMQKQLAKALIRGFNGEADALLVKVSVSNVDKKVIALRKSFEQLNKMYQRNFIALNYDYLDLKIDELFLASEFELQKQEEKEILREQREKEREDKKIQAEIKSRRKQLEKDRKHFKQLLETLETTLETASDEEANNLKLQISEYQGKLSELDEIEEDIDYREGHATAGYVYIISNIGAFGEDVYKIGVTRRLDPMDRIRELGNASVPFKFDVHALIFSEQAFALETELHSKFEDYKVNKVNGRKEYFKV